MNICFISNYYKTYQFHEVAKILRDTYGIRVYWVTFDLKYYNFLIKEYGEKNVLHLNKKYTLKPSPIIADFKINELVLGDRVLSKYKDLSLAQSFLQNIQVPIYEFLKSNELRFVFGEITWAHEVLIHRICSNREELGCKFLNPHTVRLPSDRFAFFEDEFQSKFFHLKSTLPSCNLSFEVKRPDYLFNNDRILKDKSSLKGLITRTWDFICNKNHNDSLDVTRGNKMRISVEKFKEIRNRFVYRFFVKKINLVELSGKFIFFPLHKQPEASVDVLGRYYENQFDLIKNIWRCLPTDWTLVVKEHSNAIGDRNFSFYKKVLKLPGVYLIEESTNSHDLIKASEMIFTISGTVALEAVYMSKPALTFANCYFNGFGSCYKISWEELRNCQNLVHMIKGLTDQGGKSQDELKEYVMSSSYIGIIGDHIHTLRALEPANIVALSKAFLTIINS